MRLLIIKKSQLHRYKRLGYCDHWCVILYVYNKLDKPLEMVADNIVWVKDKNKYIINLRSLL